MIAILVWTGTLLLDRKKLQEELIRFHVVANSDREYDQNVKLQVRDAVLESLHTGMEDIADVDQARAYLQNHLPQIQNTVQKVLQKAGVDTDCVVTLCKETFETRQYDTFTLPAGIYEALRIVIGEGQGHNWWCVTFPAFCVPDSSEDFKTAAVGAGFSDALSRALSGEDCEIRFFFLDQLGRLENIFFEG